MLLATNWGSLIKVSFRPSAWLFVSCLSLKRCVLGRPFVKRFALCWTDRDAIWIDDSRWPKEPCIRWSPDSPWERAILTGERAAHCKVRGRSVLSCAKATVPMQMPFETWPPVGPKKHVLGHVHIGATCRILVNHPGAAAMCPVVNFTLTTCYGRPA